MASNQRRDNGDGLADLTTKATHFFKIIMPGTLEEGKLVSILYFLIFFFVYENHTVTLIVVHLIFCICDSSKNLHLLMTYLI